MGVSGNQNWDDLLRDYEDFVDQYLVVIRKLQNNDLSGMTESCMLLAKAQKLDDELKKAQQDNSLNTEQMSRFMKIESKLLAVSAEMMNNK